MEFENGPDTSPDRTRMWGRYFNFPSCCVEHYIKAFYVEHVLPAEVYGVVADEEFETIWVPCDAHKVTPPEGMTYYTYDELSAITPVAEPDDGQCSCEYCVEAEA